MDQDIIIRSERVGDEAAIGRVNDLAFGQPNEGRLIEALRRHKNFIGGLSLVADYHGEIIGHILFFPVKIRTEAGMRRTLSLAPLSVMPRYQGRGIGGKLILRGLKEARALGYRSVVVLGHPDYYPRFGFTRASDWRIYCPLKAPDDAFMAIELTEGALEGIHGTVVFPEEYNED